MILERCAAWGLEMSFKLVDGMCALANRTPALLCRVLKMDVDGMLSTNLCLGRPPRDAALYLIYMLSYSRVMLREELTTANNCRWL